MDTKHFFTRIFPQVDELVISVHRPDPTGKTPRGLFWNRGSFTDIDAAVAAVQAWDAEPDTTVYFGVGSFAGHGYTDDKGRQKWYRKQEHATWFKALALDLDIGADKPYKTQKEGWAALRAALETAGIPHPMLVSSGRGIHCYWPLTENIRKEHWVKASTALRVALEESNVVIDTSKIHDPSMVLRPAGTHHKKQQPWKTVRVVADCADFEPVALFQTLKPWIGKAARAAAAPRKSSKPSSSILSAVLNSNDVLIDAVASRCRQVGALVASGGVTDAAGNTVTEPLWRASLGLVKHATDVPYAVTLIAGKHPDFDLQSSLDKMAGWHGSGPTTCAKFEQMCGRGCDGCPHKGKVTSPAQLSMRTETIVEDAETGEVTSLPMPAGYTIREAKVFREIIVTENTTDANGNSTSVDMVDYELISPYEMHVTGVYNDRESAKSAFRLMVKYPMAGWKEEEHEMAVIAVAGKEFSTFLLNRQVYIKTLGSQEKLRTYLMDYLSMVQSLAPSGEDYTAFGWQKDGSFMCGPTIIGSPDGVTDTRLRGAAKAYGEIIGTHGERSEWVRAMSMLNGAGTDTIRAAVLLSTIGLLGPAAGNSTLVVSIYSTETTTGKTLSLIAANSLIGNPRDLLLNRKDTANAMYKIRGVLNHLPACMDEVTTADEKDVADMLYDFSQGREKIRMAKDGSLRDPATWAGPTFMTTNISLYQKVESAQAGNEPLKARCLELPQHDRTFVTPREGELRSDAYEFFDLVAKNNGWAFPELIAAVQAMGGPQALWDRAERAFEPHFKFQFEPQERFYRTALISAWAIGRIGAKLGLFPFDVEATIAYLLAHVRSSRAWEEAHKVDVFDTIGQFFAEHNDQIVEARCKYGTDNEQVTMPAPERAVARVKLVYDATTPVMPGSVVAINAEKLRQWLKLKRDGLDRIERALEDEGALIRRRERVTMFKGCPKHAPGQAQCIIINLNHPRFVDSLTGTSSRPQSPITLAVLNGATGAA
ncbi:MAG: DUF927 domain-containing protein [Schleiferiaceae bacterium]